MHKLLERVEKELENIADKGLSSSNLETTYKLIDIYKDIKESKYYDEQCGEYGAGRMRDSRGRYMGDRDRDRRYDRDYHDYDDKWSDDRYGTYPMNTRINRYFDKIRDSMDTYDYDHERYRKGDNPDRLVEGMEMIMDAICNFVEELSDYAETSQEKEVIRKHLNKMKNI